MGEIGFHKGNIPHKCSPLTGINTTSFDEGVETRRACRRSPPENGRLPKPIDQILISQYESSIDSQPFCHGTDDDRPKLCIEWQGTVDTPPAFTYHSQSMRIIYHEYDFFIGSNSVDRKSTRLNSSHVRIS